MAAAPRRRRIYKAPNAAPNNPSAANTGQLVLALLAHRDEQVCLLKSNLVSEADGTLCSILISTGHIIEKSFGRRDGAWAVDAIGFVPPCGSTDRSELWKKLISQADAIGSLSDIGLYGQVQSALGDLFERCTEVFQTYEPSMAVFLWPMCLALLKIRLMKISRCVGSDGTRRAYSPLPWLFLGRARACLQSRLGAKSDPIMLVTALFYALQGEPGNFKRVLQVAYHKSVDTIIRIVGDRHPLSLATWAAHSPHWKCEPHALDRAVYKHYSHLLSTIRHAPSAVQQGGIPDIALLHDCSRLMYIGIVRVYGKLGNYRPLPPDPIWLEGETPPFEHVLFELHRRAIEFCGRFAGTSSGVAVRALVFSTDALVAIHSDMMYEHFILRILDNTIEVLRGGDLECCIWAAQFSKRRMLLLKPPKRQHLKGQTRDSFLQDNQDLVKSHKQELQRLRDIRGRLPKNPMIAPTGKHQHQRRCEEVCKGGGGRIGKHPKEPKPKTLRTRAVRNQHRAIRSGVVENQNKAAAEMGHFPGWDIVN